MNIQAYLAEWQQPTYIHGSFQQLFTFTAADLPLDGAHATHVAEHGFGEGRAWGSNVDNCWLLVPDQLHCIRANILLHQIPPPLEVDAQVGGVAPRLNLWRQAWRAEYL